MSAQPVRYKITANQYERMGEAGIFHPDARLELLEGSIYELPYINPPHAGCVNHLNAILHCLFMRRFIVSIQHPIRLDDYSEPQPDVALLCWRDDFYRHAHPTPADVPLIIEVADSTVETDRSYKVLLYAKAGIAEVWLVNLPEEQVELFASPVNDVYQIAATFKRGDIAQSQTINDLNINVSDVLG